MSVLLTDVEVIDIELNLDNYLKRFLFYMLIACTVVSISVFKCRLYYFTIDHNN